MRALRWIAVSAMSLGLMACDAKYDGTLTMLLDLMVTTKNGVATVNAGRYDATLRIKSERDIQLDINAGQNQNLRIPFRVTANSRLPANGNGPIFISGADNSQNFDVVGTMTTITHDSPLYYEHNQCRYTVPVQECYTDANGRTRCRTVYETRWGWERVEFFYRDYDETIQADLKIIVDGRVAGRFSANEKYSVRYETYRSRCW